MVMGDGAWRWALGDDVAFLDRSIVAVSKVSLSDVDRAPSIVHDLCEDVVALLASGTDPIQWAFGVCTSGGIEVVLVSLQLVGQPAG